MDDLNWKDDSFDDYFADLTGNLLPGIPENSENTTNSYDDLDYYDDITANELNFCKFDELESKNELKTEIFEQYTNDNQNIDLLHYELLEEICSQKEIEDLIDFSDSKMDLEYKNPSVNLYDWGKTNLNAETELNERLKLLEDENVEVNSSLNSIKMEISRPTSPDIFMISDDENENNLSTNFNNIQSRHKEIIGKIEELIKMLEQNLVIEGNMELFIPDTSKWFNFEMQNGILHLSQNATQRRVSTDNSNSTFRFTLIMHLLSEIYQLLLKRSSCTVRELYYNDPVLFKKQENVNNALKDICCYLQVAPWELGIFSSSKGLIAGSLNFILPNDEIIDCSELCQNGTILPLDTASVELLHSNAEFVLIVEKDTVFEKLLRSNILINISKDIILITGKGYPDINTRIMINKIWKKFNIPIYALVDADPFGIEIMFVYRYGSKSMAYNSNYLTCPKLQWIGIHPSEIDILGIPSIPLTKEDNKKIIELLQRPYLEDDVRKELEIFQKTNKKAEIEAVSSCSLNFLINDYIVNKVNKKLFI